MQVGEKLGSYEVLAKIGEGGMGEVYRARDTKLGRDVALKVLPDAFARDPERLARFEREAHVLASLNHPSIAQLHGLEDSGTTRALVMELVEGQDLAERIAAGPLPIDEAIAIAQQIGAALESAHELGIIHRDLKPANVKVRPDGTVKVLDFGLAKALEQGSGTRDPFDKAQGKQGSGDDADVVNSPTITSPAAMTQRGVILGTASYMAPEQAKGKSVDKRADIWAFGCVLYEMLTARRAFAADDVSETLAYVLTKDVDWTALPSQTPAAVRTLLRHCLEKNPRERLRDIGDARLVLREPVERPEPPLRDRRRAFRSVAMAWAVAGLAIVVAAVAGFAAWRRGPVPAESVTRFVIDPPNPGELLTDPLVAPDGRFVVVRGRQLYVRRLSEFETRPLPGTEHAEMPFLSPDGQWVGFFADGKLKKVAVAGGDPLVLCGADADSPGAAWAPANRILFTVAWSGAPLVSVAAAGGPVTPVSTLDSSRKERAHWWPEPLPDGRHVLFTIFFAGAGIAESEVAVLDLETGKHRPLFPGALARYAARRLVFLRAGAFQAVDFDPDTLTTTGEPQRVLPDARAQPAAGLSAKSVALSESGTLAYQTGELYPERAVSWLGRDGRTETTPLTLRHNGVALSPDGRLVAYGRAQNGTSQIVVYDLSHWTEQRVSTLGWNFGPAWHPDGRQIAFTSMRKGDFDIYVQSIDGGPAEPLMVGETDEELQGWGAAPDQFVARIWETGRRTPVYLVSTKRSVRLPLLTEGFATGAMEVSPDGRWIAFCASPGGDWQLYVRALSEGARLQPIGGCRRADQDVHWSARTHELLITRGTELVALSYSDSAGRFVLQGERILARIGADDRFYGVTPDGQRFLIGKRVRPAIGEAGIRVVVNGLETLAKP